MGIMRRIMGTADPATGKTGRSTDPRMKGAGRGRTTRATRGKVPPGRKSWSKGKAPVKTSSGGLGKLFSSLTGRR
jgi:hypothetical protein